MLAKTESIAIIGADAHLVEIEVDVSGGLPGFTIVGLPTKSVREAEQRTRSAIEASGRPWVRQRVVANLAPGGLRKDGTHFDLPLALGLLAGARLIDGKPLEGWVIIGELALNGTLRPVRGALAAAMACRAAGRRGLVCPASNAPEAALVDGIEVVPVTTLDDCIRWLAGELDKGQVAPAGVADEDARAIEDLCEVRGHRGAKRAAEVAAAGGHNLMLVGPPGSGKTMLARRLPGILPPMSLDESLEVTRISSVAGMLTDRPRLVRERPFRSPHQHVSVAGLVGGGTGLPRPGEISLAHNGVLFLDELSLYRRDVLEALRAPLEEGIVRIARSGGVIAYPCRFALVAAMNPCGCGYLGDSMRACRCSEHQLQIYRSKLSGPLLDRIDIHVGMARLGKGELLGAGDGESSADVATRVAAARAAQALRYQPAQLTNASAPKAQLEAGLELTSGARSGLGMAIDALALSGRGLDRALRVARTIADLDGRPQVAEDDVSEALSYRSDHSCLRSAA